MKSSIVTEFESGPKAKSNSTVACQGRVLQFPVSMLEEAATFLREMEEVCPEDLDQYFEKLPHVNREQCVGIVLSYEYRKVVPPGIPHGLLLSTAVDEVHSIISLECNGSRKQGCKRRSCAHCQFLFESCSIRIKKTTIAPAAEENHLIIDLLKPAEATLSTNISGDTATDHQVSIINLQDLHICRGREGIPAMAIEETAVALNSMTSERPEDLDKLFKRLSHVDRQLCVGLILGKPSRFGPAGLPIGLVLSIADTDAFVVMSVACAGTCVSALGCNKCSMLWYLCRTRTNWKLDEVPRPVSVRSCQGRDQALSQAVIEEAAIALLSLEERSPEKLVAIFEALPHINRDHCVGVIWRKSGVCIGLILSTTANAIFRIVSLDCTGSCRVFANSSKSDSDGALSCSKCRKFYHRQRLEKVWKTDKPVTQSSVSISASTNKLGLNIVNQQLGSVCKRLQQMEEDKWVARGYTDIRIPLQDEILVAKADADAARRQLTDLMPGPYHAPAGDLMAINTPNSNIEGSPRAPSLSVKSRQESHVAQITQEKRSIESTHPEVEQDSRSSSKRQRKVPILYSDYMMSAEIASVLPDMEEDPPATPPCARIAAIPAERTKLYFSTSPDGVPPTAKQAVIGLPPRDALIKQLRLPKRPMGAPPLPPHKESGQDKEALEIISAPKVPEVASTATPVILHEVEVDEQMELPFEQQATAIGDEDNDDLTELENRILVRLRGDMAAVKRRRESMQAYLLQ